jgi:hypothetical protein
MTERLIDAVCPHCGRVGTTVRVVLHEDGYTKLSRRCTDCGGECIHTFDHDWLSVARNKKLQADNECLTNAVALVSERVRQLSEERDYAWGEVEKLRADLATQQGCCDGAAAQDAHIRQEREERRAEIKNLRANNKRMRELLSAIQIDTNADGSVWLTLSPSAYPGFIAVVHLGSQKLMAGTAALLFDELRRKALEGKP